MDDKNFETNKDIINPIDELFNNGSKSYMINDQVLDTINKLASVGFLFNNHHVGIIVEINEVTNRFVALGLPLFNLEYGTRCAIVDAKTHAYRDFTPVLVSHTGKFGSIFSFDKNNRLGLGDLIFYEKSLNQKSSDPEFRPISIGQCFSGQDENKKDIDPVSMYVFSVGLGKNIIDDPSLDFWMSLYYNEGIVSRILNNEKKEVVNAVVTSLVGFDKTFSYRESQAGLLEWYFDYFEVKPYDLEKYECAPISAIKTGFVIEKTGLAASFTEFQKFECLESEYGTIILTAISFKVSGLYSANIGDTVGLFYNSFSNPKISDGFIHEIKPEHGYCSVVFFKNLEKIKIDDYSTGDVGYLFKLSL